MQPQETLPLKVKMRSNVRCEQFQQKREPNHRLGAGFDHHVSPRVRIALKMALGRMAFSIFTGFG